jgi:hypothetical protein
MATPSGTRQFGDKVWRIIFSAQAFPIILALAVIGVLFVVVRMKGIEQTYRFNGLTKQIKTAVSESKDLTAQLAKLMTVSNMRILAEKHGLKEPRQDQIIVIP